MRRILFVACGMFALLPLAQLRADDAELQAIIDKSIEASGGLENLEKFQNQQGKEEGTYHGGGDAMPFTATFASAAPDKFRMEVEGVFTLVYDGEQGWIQSGGETRPMDEEQLKEQRLQTHSSWIVSLVPLAKEKDKFKLTKIDGEDVNGRETVGIRVSSDGHRDVELFFDKENHDLLKADHVVRASETGFNEVEQEAIFSEFKEISGVRMPTKVLLRRDGDTYVEARLFDIEPVEEFPEGTFGKP